MIELPEAVTLAAQVRDELMGRTIEYADAGNSPHKFAWYGPHKDEFGTALPGKRVTGATGTPTGLVMHLSDGYVFLFGDGGPVLSLHAAGARLPAKRQLLFRFDDGRSLTASIRMYGYLSLLTEQELAARPDPGVTPLDRSFTAARLTQMLRGYEGAASKSIKYFIISAHLVGGIGNGYLQDVLFRAGVSPMRKVCGLTDADCKALHAAAVGTIKEAIAAGGRDTERDLLGRPGGYRCTLDSRVAGKPCPRCGAPIVKKAYLGGSVYFCPQCQP
jgi:formamidopyrimidine-DNA glycosylase